jgi:hypothetical protein
MPLLDISDIHHYDTVETVTFSTVKSHITVDLLVLGTIPLLALRLTRVKAISNSSVLEPMTFDDCYSR